MAVALAGKGPTWMQEGGDTFFRDHEQAKWLQDCVRQERKKGYVHAVVKKCISDRAQTIRDTQ